MDTQAPREIPLHESANRPNQILGCDREMVIVSGITSLMMALALGNSSGVVWARLMSWLCGLIFWLASVWVLTRMGKADPLLRQVYVRHIRYRTFYPAKAGLHSLKPQTRLWR